MLENIDPIRYIVIDTVTPVWRHKDLYLLKIRLKTVTVDEYDNILSNKIKFQVSPFTIGPFNRFFFNLNITKTWRSDLPFSSFSYHNNNDVI